MISTVCAVAWEYYPEDIPATLEDIAEVIADDCTGGDDGYAEEEIVGIFRLKDGRFLYVSGGCDTTGWDCQSSASGEIRNTLGDIVRECCTDDERKRLGIEMNLALGHTVVHVKGQLVS
jgi:hypothetical protein